MSSAMTWMGNGSVSVGTRSGTGSSAMPREESVDELRDSSLEPLASVEA